MSYDNGGWDEQELKEEIKTVTFKNETIKLPFSCYVDKQPYKFALDREVTAKYYFKQVLILLNN